MIGGAALILVSGFAAASMARSYTETVDVLVAAEPIAEGEPIQVDQLAVVAIAAGEGDIQAIDPSLGDDLVGRVASGPIGKGSILHPDQFVGNDASEQMVIVGMALDPDEFPTENLQVGDLVRLFDVGSSFGSDTETVAQEITIGEVVAVRPLGAGNEVHYSVRVKESTANAVTSRVTQDALAIALVEETQQRRARSQAPMEPGAGADPLAPAEPLRPGDPLFDGDAAPEEDQ